MEAARGQLPHMVITHAGAPSEFALMSLIKKGKGMAASFKHEGGGRSDWRDCQPRILGH
jgi:hypothetical protein